MGNIGIAHPKYYAQNLVLAHAMHVNSFNWPQEISRTLQNSQHTSTLATDQGSPPLKEH
jgi:hypothetical protein